MDNQLTVLKRDVRVRVPARLRRGRGPSPSIGAGRSELSACKMAGISKNTFWSWLQSHGLTQKRGLSPSKSSSHAPVRFVQVVAQAAPASALLVRLPGGATAEVADELQAVLAARLVQSLA